MAIPVPVPKESLFKAKAGVKGVKAFVAEVQGAAQATVAAAGAGNGEGAGVPLLPKAKATLKPKSVLDLKPKPGPTPAPAPASLIDVVIPPQLYHMIMSKPSTGGGWQSLMAQLQESVTIGSGMVDISGNYTLNLAPYLLAKIVDKATIGSGGYQAVMRWIVCLAAKQHPGQVIAGKGEGE